MYGVESGSGLADPARLAGAPLRPGAGHRRAPRAPDAACPGSSSAPCSPPATRRRTCSTPCPPSSARWRSPPPTSRSAASARSADRCCGARRCRRAPPRPAIPGCSCAPPPPRPTTPTRTGCSRRPSPRSTGRAATPSTAWRAYTDEVVKRARHNGQHAGRLLEHQTLAQVPVVAPDRPDAPPHPGRQPAPHLPARARAPAAGGRADAGRAPQRASPTSAHGPSTTCSPPPCSTSRTSPAPRPVLRSDHGGLAAGPLTVPPPRPHAATPATSTASPSATCCSTSPTRCTAMPVQARARLRGARRHASGRAGGGRGRRGGSRRRSALG